MNIKANFHAVLYCVVYIKTKMIEFTIQKI